DVGTQMRMASAADGLGLLDMAVWFLEQARQPNPNNRKVNRALARLYEKRGNFTQAIALWDLLRKADPTDVEAQHKAKDLAASDTIARGRYQEVLIAALPKDEPEEMPALDESESAAEETPRETVATPVPGVTDRLAREAAPLQERIETNPTSPHAYLQLAVLYRPSHPPEKARAAARHGAGPAAKH